MNTQSIPDAFETFRDFRKMTQNEPTMTKVEPTDSKTLSIAAIFESSMIGNTAIPRIVPSQTFISGHWDLEVSPLNTSTDPAICPYGDHAGGECFAFYFIPITIFRDIHIFKENLEFEIMHGRHITTASEYSKQWFRHAILPLRSQLTLLTAQ